MASWPRLVAATALVAVTAVPQIAQAQKTPAQQAQKYDKDGKQLFRNKDYKGAANKFRQAVVLDPSGRYYFNLCFTLYMMGKYQEALTACRAVEPNGADKELKSKTHMVMGKIQQAMGGGSQGKTSGAGGGPSPGGGKAGAGDAHSGANSAGAGGGAPTGNGSRAGTAGANGGQGGGPPGNRNAAGSRTAASAQPAAYGPYVGQKAKPPAGSYEWSLGADVGLTGNFGLGTRAYKRAGVYVRGFADFMLSKKHRFGLQAYLDYARFDLLPSAPAMVATNSDGLGVIDLGAAVYQHRRLSKSWYWTPLAGLSLALLQPSVDASAIATLGARAEVSFDWVFGADGNQVITLTPASLTAYAPAKAGNTTLDPSMYGLNHGGATFMVSVGYTMRFSSPFGSTPIITLE